jgi:hypothetical protein
VLASPVPLLQRAWLLGLLIPWAGLLFGGFVFGKADAKRERRMPTWTRIGSSLVLVLAGWSWFLVSRDTSAEVFALLIAAGMSLGALGDLFMANLLPVSQPVLGGIGAFGLGHVAYIAGIVSFGNRLGLDAPALRSGAWAAWFLIGAIAWYLVVFRGSQRTALHWAALPYALLLASTAGVATGLAVQQIAFVPLAIGAALFLLSDLILAARLFTGRHFALIDDIVWLTYEPGQMLIVYSIGSALRVVGA